MNRISHGFVVDNRDPLKVGRCRVRIIGLYDSLKEEELPWLMSMSPINLDKMVYPPRIGTQVICMSLDEYDQNIIILGIIYGIGESGVDTSSRALENYPYNRVLETEGGNLIEIDDTEGSERINIEHNTGSNIEILPNGDIYINSAFSEVTGNLSVGSGATGSFSTPTGTTVTVQNGIITNIY